MKILSYKTDSLTLCGRGGEAGQIGMCLKLLVTSASRTYLNLNRGIYGEFITLLAIVGVRASWVIYLIK